jgi:hypothetical protein
MAILSTGCDQVKPLKMPTDTTKEGPGLFSGDKGYWDLTEIAGINQDQQQRPSPCSTPNEE